MDTIRALRRITKQLKIYLDDKRSMVLTSAIAYIAFKYNGDRKKYSIGHAKISKLYMDAIQNDSNKDNLKLIFDNLEDIEKIVPKENLDAVFKIIFNISDYKDITKIIIAQGNQFGKMYSESATPDFLNELLIKLANIKSDDTVLDPSSGIGGTLLTILQNNPNQIVAGQEINTLNFAISQILIEINSAKNASIYLGDTLSSPRYVKDGHLERFDVVLSIPPFGVNAHLDKGLEDDYNRYSFGNIPSSRADWAFIMNAINSAKEDTGRSLVVMPQGVLFRGGSEKTIRQNILKDDLFEAIISLPGRIFSSTSIPTAILIFNHNKPIEKKNKIVFINVPMSDIVQGKKLDEVSLNGIDKIVDTTKSFKKIDGYSSVVARKDINPDSMSVGKYIKNQIYNFDGEKYKIKIGDFYQGNNIELSKVAKLNRGYNITAKNETPDGIYNIVKISDISNEGISYDRMVRGNVDERAKVDNYELRPDDIVIAVRGENNKMIKVNDNVKDKTLINSNLVRIRVNQKLYLPEFIKLFIESPIGNAELDDIAMGTTVRQIPIKMLETYQIPRLSLDEQKKILHDYEIQNLQIKRDMDALLQRKNNMNEDLYTRMGIADFYKKD